MRKIIFILMLLLAPLAQAQLSVEFPKTQQELQELEKKAKEGDLKSQYVLARCYMEGVDGLVSRKYGKGEKMLKNAANRGSADACRVLFKLYPMNENYRDRAIEIYRSIWRNGPACYNIADMYGNEPSVSLRWLKTAWMLEYEPATQDLLAFHRSTYSQESFKNWLDKIQPMPDFDRKQAVAQQDTSSVNISYDSDVNINIPLAKTPDEKTRVVIIANQNYENMPDVPYAWSDGDIFKKYCETTLGIPAKNIKYRNNITLGQMKTLLKTLPSDDKNIIFYYAGHGLPIDKKNATGDDSKDACLVMVDAENEQSECVYPINDLLAQLGDTKSPKVTVFLDACFSGRTRGSGMVAEGARSVAIRASDTTPKKGNIVVMSASSGTEAAWPHQKQSHGLFTYFLLKRLQETDGNTSLGDLADYIKKNVEELSAEQGRTQTPSVICSEAVASKWRSWTLK